MEGAQNLEDFKVGSLPTLFYVPNFISDSEQTHVINQIYQSPISKWKSLKNRRLQNWGGVVHEKGLLPQKLPPWLTKITERICEKTGLFPSAINHVLINEYLPDQGIMPHQDGPLYFPVVAIISLGGAAVMNFIPHSRLKITSNNTDKVTDCDISTADQEDELCLNNQDHSSSVLLMPCSLLLFKDDAYLDYLHGIEDNSVHQLDKAVNISRPLKEDPSFPDAIGAKSIGQIQSLHRTSTRISLTCRLVLKVHSNLFKI